MALPREEFLKRMAEGRARAKAGREARRLIESAIGTTQPTSPVEGDGGSAPHHAVVKIGRIINYWRFGGGIAAGVVGLVLLVIGNFARNPVLIAIGAVSVVGGAWMAFAAYTKNVGPGISAKDRIKNANCFILSDGRLTPHYEASADRLYGLPRQCLNDGKYYWLHIQGLDGNGSIEALRKPDFSAGNQYYDPREAFNCLRMKLGKRYFNYAPNGSGVVSIIVMAVVIGAELIALVAMGG